MIAKTDWIAGFSPLAPVYLTGEMTADMRDLGVGIPPSPAGVMKAPRDVDELLGVLYVLEGSALGAHLIYSQARALGLSGEHGARHLALQTASPGRWRSFLTLLESTGFPSGMDRCVRASVETFALAERAFAGETDVAA